MPRRAKRIQAGVDDLLDRFEISAPPIDVNKIAKGLGIQIKEGGPRGYLRVSLQ